MILTGDAIEMLKTLSADSVDCCITSPPYWSLRDYGIDGQIGLEKTPEQYIENLVAVFREVRRVMKKNGTLWLNLGDSYAAGGHGGHRKSDTFHGHTKRSGCCHPKKAPPGLKPKDLVGAPWRVAFALQANGWYLRSDIIWHKTNPLPESVKDRPTKSHEYMFLLAKSRRYFYDHKAIQERTKWPQGPNSPQSIRSPFGQGFMRRARGGKTAFRGQGHFRVGGGPANRPDRNMKDVGTDKYRNRRTVWTISTKPFKEAHFATFPDELVEPCILAGCPKGGTVLDPFLGAGTVGVVAERLGREWIGVELSPEYVAMANRRIEFCRRGVGKKNRRRSRRFHTGCR